MYAPWCANNNQNSSLLVQIVLTMQGVQSKQTHTHMCMRIFITFADVMDKVAKAPMAQPAGTGEGADAGVDVDGGAGAGTQDGHMRVGGLTVDVAALKAQVS